MAYEAVDSLQQTLLLILQYYGDHVITPTVKQQIVSIHHKAVVLQFNLKRFPEKETIREVANTAEEIIHYLFFTQNISDFGSIDPSVRLSDQLGQLAEVLDPTVGYVVDYCKSKGDSVNDASNSSAVSSSSGSALLAELLATYTNKLRRLADKIKSTGRELPYEDLCDLLPLTTKDAAAGFGSIDPSVRLLDQLGQLAEELDPTVGYVVDYCNSKVDSVNNVSNSSAVSSSSRSALKSQVEDLPAELLAIHTYRLRRLVDKIKSTGRELPNEDPSDLLPLTTEDAVAGFYDDPNDSASVTSSSSFASTSKYFLDGFAAEDPSDSLSRLPPMANDDVVGFDEDIAKMMCRITDYSSDLQILSIVGMGGIGKSTLAKCVYDHPLIMYQYGIRAWLTISQDYTVASILSQLLASVKGKLEQDSLKVLEAEELEIRKILSVRRYLIVMDDIWSVEVWLHVERLFPNNNNGSRIILTTRLMDVATYASDPWNIHMMHFLDDEQSWRLFNHKVFGNQECPLELQSVGEKIVKGCGGLPLQIVSVAGILSRIPRTSKVWQQIEVNDGQLGSILSLSYNHLPPYLRPCFLYMAAFPQDYDIHASELIKLWVAEGFIERPSESERVEVMAEWWLEKLIEQSLVLITSRKSDGKIKSCRLHSTVRDFCVRQAELEKFLLSVTDYFPNLILRKHFLPQVIQNHHRVSVSWHDLHLKDSTHSSCTTSIICIPQRGYRPKGYVENFRSLRVFHVLRRKDYSYWELGQVFELINLTYLSSNIPDNIVPSAISKLQNLQTLIIYRSEVRLPVEIWSLRQLRHLIAFSFHPLPLPKGDTPLKKLQTLSIATNFVCSERMVDLIRNIRKLGICYSKEDFSAGYYLENLIDLCRLEKLKLKMHSSSVPHPYSLIFPLSLKKLELSGGWISWTDMTIVGSLPNLQVLKLKNHACYGDRWETIHSEFRKLILLLIDESNLKHWKTSSRHFPMLKCLMLHRCPYLDEIPLDIGKIQTLELIEIDDHNQSLLYSANIIDDIHRKDWGDGLQKVVVQRS